METWDAITSRRNVRSFEGAQSATRMIQDSSTEIQPRSLEG